jgi:glycosyltransferase involved in cell wall biosynthesis
MKILMLSDVYFPRVNGVSTSIHTFRHQARRRGHQVTLLAPRYGLGEEDEAGVARIPSRRVPGDPEDRMVRLRRLVEAGRRRAGEGFDLIHVQTPFVAHYAGLRLARELELPVVETYHTYFEEYLGHYVPFLPDALLRRLARSFSRRQCNQLDGLIVPSRAMREVLERYGATTRTAVIPTGLAPADLERGDGPAFRARRGIPGNRPVLLCVGRMAHEKNLGFLLHVLVRVVEKRPDALLVLAGEGPARKSLETLSRHLGLERNTLFVGYLVRDGALQDCYQAADAFVFASRTETQGLVLLEAMAQGLPVVSTAVMGTRDLLDAGRGALVAGEDVEGFAAKVLELLDDPTLARRLGEEGEALAREWSSECLVEPILGFYREVVEASRERIRARGGEEALRRAAEG